MYANRLAPRRSRPSLSAPQSLKSRLRRRLAVELLEQRLVLNATNETISTWQEQALLDGIAGVENWADDLARHDLSAALLPVVGQSIGQSMDLAQVFHLALTTPMNDYFATTPTPDTDGLVAALQNAGGTFGDLAITVNNVSGGLTQPGGDEFLFELILQAERSLEAGISAGPEGARLGLAASGTVDATASMELDFAFGLDLTPSLIAEEAFFIRIDSWDIGLQSNPPSMPPLPAPGRIGFYDASLTGGSASLDAMLDITLTSGTPQGTLTLAELQEESLEDLVSMSGGGTASVDLQYATTSFAGFTPGSSPLVTLPASDPFNPAPLQTNADFESLRPFTEMSEFSMLGVLGQIAHWFDRLGETTVMQKPLFLIEDRIGDAAQLGTVLQEGLLKELYDPQADPQPGPTFRTVQQLSDRLQTALGMTAAEVNPSYNPDTFELTFHVVVEHVFDADSRDFAVDLIDLGLDWPLMELDTSAEVDVQVMGQIEFTFGVAMVPLSARLVGEADGPGNGQLSADAVFDLSLGGGEFETVTVPLAVTQSNTSLQDLVDDFNDALTDAGFGGTVIATIEGDRLVLQTTPNAPVEMLWLKADAGNPIVTELHFLPDHLALDSLLGHAFIENASVHVDVELEAENVDASARLLGIGVSIEDGQVEADVGLMLDITDPLGIPGGRVSMMELFHALAVDITQVVAGPTLDGSVEVLLPLSANVFGVESSGDAKIHVQWDDIGDPGSLQIDLIDIDELLNFQELTGESIADFIGQAILSLADFFGLQGTASEFVIPGLNVSLAEVVEFGEKLAKTVEQIVVAVDPSVRLEELADEIRQALNLTTEQFSLELVEDGEVLRMDLSLEETVFAQVPLDFDFSVVNMGDLGNLLDFKGEGLLDVSVDLMFDLFAGIDLSNPLNPKPFLYETSQAEAAVRILGQPIHFFSQILFTQIAVHNGQFVIDGDGDTATEEDRAVVTLSLDDLDMMTNEGKIYIDEFQLSNIVLSIEGAMSATLPVYIPPTPSPGNLIGNLEIAIGDLGDIENTITIDFPDLEQILEDLFTTDDFDLFNNVGVMLDGLDLVLGGFEDVFRGKILFMRFPIIGNNLGEVAEFFSDIRTGALEEIRNRFAESNNNTAEVLQQALFDAFGPGGLNVLLDYNDDSQITIEDVHVDYITEDGRLVDIRYDMKLGAAATLLDTSIDFDLGLPVFGLAMDGGIEVELGFQWDLSFGVSRDHGFYMYVGQQDELSVGLDVRIPDFDATGRLGFLQASAKDNSENPSYLTAQLVADFVDPLRDPQDDDYGFVSFGDWTGGKFNIGDVVDVRLEGETEVNLDLLVSFDADARFPSLAADLNVHWVFNTAGNGDGNGSSMGTMGPGNGQSDVPTVELNNVRIDLGDLVSSFAASTLSTVRGVTAPLDPVAEFVTSPLPLLDEFGLEITPLDLARALGFGDAADFVEALADLITASNSVPVVSDQIYISLGSFRFSGVDLTQEDPEIDPEQNIEPTDPKDPEQELELADQDAADFFGQLRDMGILFPILDKPLSTVQLLLGRDIDLFIYDMPELRLEFPFPILKIGPIIPPVPLFAAFSGSVGATVDLAFGFDTRGLRKFDQSGDFLDVFSGFYIWDIEPTDGPQKPEATLFVNVNASAELSLVAVSAGVSGGITASLFADLVDPNDDGKIHIDEFLNNLDLGFACTFDLSGEVRAELNAYVEFLFQRVNFEIANFEIASFQLTDSMCFPDRFSGNDSREYATYLGIGPGLHLEGMSIFPESEEDWFKFDLLQDDSIDVTVRHSNAKGNLDVAVFKVVDDEDILLGTSTTLHDGKRVQLNNLQAGTYYVRVTGDGKMNNYSLSVTPAAASNTRVIYVSPPGAKNKEVSYYALASGSDANDGLSPRRPMASLQNVLDTYQLGQNDLVVFDTGVFHLPATMTGDDSGATFVGSVGGSTLAALTMDGTSDNRFVDLSFSSIDTALLLVDSHDNSFDNVQFTSQTQAMEVLSSQFNTFNNSRFQGTGDGVLIVEGDAGDSLGNVIVDSLFLSGGVALEFVARLMEDEGIFYFHEHPNRIEGNIFDGSGGTGIHFGPGTTPIVTDNDISGFALGMLIDSTVADVYGNRVFDNAIGISSLRGVIGPDNPAPYGAPGGRQPNEVYDNDVGIFVPEHAAGVIVRFTDVYGNNIGIEAYGDRTQIVANDVHGNNVGIQGDRIIGPENWEVGLHNLIRENQTGVLTLPGAEVRHNRIFKNHTGVQVADDTFIHHNVIYRNFDHGILVSQAADVTIENNTVYSVVGDAVRLSGMIDDVLLRNNILAVESGTALYVEAAAQFGYDSDYNNLFVFGSGNVAFQGKEFHDLYDWHVEAESDLHSIGTTVLDPGLDNPLFVDLAGDDFRLLVGSTSIVAGDPATPIGLQPHGDRVNLGAYGGTPQATQSPTHWLRVTFPNFYHDLTVDRTYELLWDSYNLDPGSTVTAVLVRESDSATLAIGSAPASSGALTWNPGSLVSGSLTERYRVELSHPQLAQPVQSREPFSIVQLAAVGQTFYVNDRDSAGDQYTTSIGDNRNTGLAPDQPKLVIRPLVLSYDLRPGDMVLVDTGLYIHAINLNLSSGPLAFDPRMNTVEGVQIIGPTIPDSVAIIDRANPALPARTLDLIGALDVTFENLTIRNAGIGLHARDGSSGLTASNLVIHQHTLEALRIENDSHDAVLEQLTVHDNGRHGIFVDSRLVRLTDSQVYDNDQIGIALRGVDAAVVEGNVVYDNFYGIDIINPGVDPAARARIGHDDLGLSLGNQVFSNAQDGIFASGNVLVAGNTVTDNGRYGIRLDGGADAVRNVARGHVTGITARGSESLILENRSFLNSQTGIEASYNSSLLRNVTYSNQLHGIHVDRFGGLIEHNLVYSTGYASVNIEGPGSDARFINNTVYEPCADNEGSTASSDLPWRWTAEMFSFMTGDGYSLLLAGDARFHFGTPMGSEGGTFELGEQDRWDAPTAEPVPVGELFEIPFELVTLNLAAIEAPDELGAVEVLLREGVPSQGVMFVENMDGILHFSLFLELNIEMVLSDMDGFLIHEDPIFLFSEGPPIDNPFGVMQVPIHLFGGGPPVMMFDPLNPDMPPWLFELSQTELGDMPPDDDQDKGDTCAEIGVIVQNSSQRVVMRNNIIYVEGAEGAAPGDESVSLIVTADSTLRFDGDFNALMTDHGLIGIWAGISAETLLQWQTISGQDAFGISPPVHQVWVDPDGDDDVLGGLSGYDDNFHLRSPYGHVTQGALAPIIDQAVGGSGLPIFLAVTWETGAAAELSPAVDAGDPAWSFALEPLEHGKFINLGAYGNTDQASISPPTYVYVASPLGTEQWVPDRMYRIEWRTDGAMPDYPGDWVEIRLIAVSGGASDFVITPLTPNTGSYLWTIPPSVSHGEYILEVVRPDQFDPDISIVGESRRPFTIGPDTTAPYIIDTEARFVEREGSTNAVIDQIVVTFSENLQPSFATDVAGFFPGATTTYLPGATDGDVSLLILDFSPSLGVGDHTLVIPGIFPFLDPAGIALDGNFDGMPGGDYVRTFTVDVTPPTVSLSPVMPEVRNTSVDTLPIVFSEEIRGIALADFRLTRDGGANLLTGEQTLSTGDHVSWLLQQLASLTAGEGVYRFEVAGGNTGIRDLAGNPLAVGDWIEWTVDTTSPRATIQPVTPDPRSGEVDEITFVFSEPVWNFLLADLSLSHDGSPIDLATAGAVLSTSDNVTWTLANLDSFTADGGIYMLTLSDSAGLHDLAGNPLHRGKREVWTVYETAPRGDILPPGRLVRNDPIDHVVIAFDRPMVGLELSDLSLTRDGGGSLLGGGQLLTTLDGIHWRLSGLTAITADEGQYALTLTAGAHIVDLSGRPLATGAELEFQVDTTAPLVTLSPVSPSLRNTAVDTITIMFSEPVFGFGLPHLSLRRDGDPVIEWTFDQVLPQLLNTTDGITWVLSGIEGLTGDDGHYTLEILVDQAITDAAGNSIATGDTIAWTMDTVPPEATMPGVAMQPLYAGDAVDELEIVFDKPVTGLNVADLTLRRDIGSNLLTGSESLTTTDGMTWVLGDLAGLTGLVGQYELSLRALGAGIQDLAGNLLPVGTFTVWDVIAPEVVGSFVYHRGSSFDSGDLADALETGKFLAKEGDEPLTLGFDNLINTSRGINGLVFDIGGLPATSLGTSDFVFQWSPQGAFNEQDNAPADWQTAFEPSSITVLPSSPSRVVIEWPDNAIANRWLRITILANANTGLTQPDVFYIGHLLGETTGPARGVYTVSFADISVIRSEVGKQVDVGSLVDINKDGIVTFLDISNMRSNIGKQLTNITIPAASENNGQFQFGTLGNSGNGEEGQDKREASGGRRLAATIESKRAASSEAAPLQVSWRSELSRTNRAKFAETVSQEVLNDSIIRSDTYDLTDDVFEALRFASNQRSQELLPMPDQPHQREESSESERLWLEETLCEVGESKSFRFKIQ